MRKGFLCIVLHAHLPFVRHPEHNYFLEENWLYEAITESYIPLLSVFERLLNDNIHFSITLSLSPSLMEMLNDDLLRNRYQHYLERLLEIADREIQRTRKDSSLHPITKMYQQRLRKTNQIFSNVYKTRLMDAFKQLHDTGRVEFITTAATHAFLPAFYMFPQAIRAQLKIALINYRKYFSSDSPGFWLPECGYKPGFDILLKEQNVRYFFLESHAVDHGYPHPPYGVYGPVSCPSGLFVFGRDNESSQQVWSSACGYPGDALYRDFYRDIGYDLNTDYIRSFRHAYGTTTYTGLKYYRITGNTFDKKPYNARAALKKAKDHARHFLQSRTAQIASLSKAFSIHPVITSLYDAELFGHWWFEGPIWLEEVMRGAQHYERFLETISATEFIEKASSRYFPLQISQPIMSSWGSRGFHEAWINKSNDILYRHLHKATELMIQLAETHPRSSGTLERALNQAAREIVLSQHSDWPFMMKSDTYSVFGAKSCSMHLGRFRDLCRMVTTGKFDLKRIAFYEEHDNIFPEINYRVFRTQ